MRTRTYHQEGLLFVLLCVLLLLHATNSFNLQQQSRLLLQSKLTVSMMSTTPPTPVWHSAKIIRNKREAEGLNLLQVEVPSSLISSFVSPGQYVKVKTGEQKPGFYAIASTPGSQVFDFLVKETENNAFFAQAKAGDIVDMSDPQGKGFLIEEFFDKYKSDWGCSNVLMMATGSGIAPIASAIDFPALALKKIGTNTLIERRGVLYLGARSENHLPFQSRFSEWESKGVIVVPVLSKPSSSWKGRTGYIQDALRADGIKVPRNSGALLCGHRGMTDNSKELMLEAGVFEGRILLNF